MRWRAENGSSDVNVSQESNGLVVETGETNYLIDWELATVAPYVLRENRKHSTVWNIEIMGLPNVSVLFCSRSFLVSATYSLTWLYGKDSCELSTFISFMNLFL